MTTLKHICVAFIILFSATGVFAQRAEITRIDTLVRLTERANKKAATANLVFADTSDYTANEAAKWQAFASEAALEKHRESSEAYSIAYAWRKGGKLTAVNFTLFSPSGDWAKYVYSYYRPDGTLAKAAIDYRTFNGDLILEQDLYFNSSGIQISKKERILDLQTHKPKRVSRDMRDSLRSMAKEVDYHMTTSKLPFIGLLK